MGLHSRLQGLAFYLLLAAAFGLIVGLAQRHGGHWDWTAQGRNSLSATSSQVLGRLQGPLKITAYAQDMARLRGPIQALVGRYQRQSPLVTLSFVNPDREPELVRRLGIRATGELILEYQGRSEHLPQVNEERLTNAIQRLLVDSERWLAFVTGHGERSPSGKANHDLGEFGKELMHKGYKIRELNLSEHPELPDKLALLIIAGPEVALLPAEVEVIGNYVKGGGNLLWLLDPGPLHGLEPLAQALGLSLLPGTIVDANAFAMGIKDAAMALVTQYPEHPALAGMDQVSLFPRAAALDFKAQPAGTQAVETGTSADSQPPRQSMAWKATPLLKTLDRTWNETGPLEGEIRPNAEQGERPGPLTLGLALERTLEGSKKLQKVVVVGDGDFLANSYLGNGGNLTLGLNLVRWLSGDDNLLGLAPKTAQDLSLELSTTQALAMGLVFLFLLPLGFFGLGFWVWWRRRRA